MLFYNLQHTKLMGEKQDHHPHEALFWHMEKASVDMPIFLNHLFMVLQIIYCFSTNKMAKKKKAHFVYFPPVPTITSLAYQI